ncbi:MAG: DHH family phosphoesterase [Candidatus Bathyarchaeota archaeon]|nr:DHH family phosphoesterase [Candidatus Bathyarchaeota archaeon]
MQLQDFEKKTNQVVTELKAKKPKEAIIVHHDDADGLCSTAITKRALEREGIKPKTFCLEKVYTEVIEDLHSKSGQTIFYVDIGSSHADMISEYNNGKNLTIILDHHDPKPAKDPQVFDLNFENYGFKGETDFSGATCCYLFAKTLNKTNMDLGYLALVGSCEIPEGFMGINKLVLEEACKNGIIQQKGKGYEIIKFKTRLDALFSKLQILGAVGYYEGGPEIGVNACLEGLSKETEEKVNALENKRKEANRRLLGRLYLERLKETEHIQWFDAGDMYAGMGTKVIGQFCSFLAYQTRLIKPNKFILGFVNVPSEIPGWGKLKEKFVKASVRVPKTMQSLIDDGKLLGAVNLLDKASEGFGVADGHRYAASVIVPVAKKQTLIENAEKQLKADGIHERAYL